jgi:hypothetical protein
LFGIYINNDIDNAWSTAWIYNFYQHGITQDIVFCEGDPSYWGVRFFSQIYCYIYGAILSVTGYTLYHVQLISLTFVALSLFFWFQIGKKILQDQKQALIFLFMLAWSSVVFAAANKARVDAMVFFLMGFSFFCWMSQWRLVSIFLACAAVETHPIGGITFLYILSYVLCYEREFLFNPLKWISSIFGLLLGAGLYFGLHHQDLGSLSTVMSSHETPKTNFLAAHFWGRHSYFFRYLPELLLFITAFIMHFFIYRKKDFFFPFIVVMMILSTYIFKRGNAHYALFAYPAFLLLTVHTVAGMRIKLVYLVTFWILLMLPQYLFLAWKNEHGRMYPDYVIQLQKLNLPKDNLIYGMPMDWFAFYDYPGFRSLTSSGRSKEFIMLEHRNTIFKQPDYQYQFDLQKYRYKKIQTVSLKSGGIIAVYQVSENKYNASERK